MNFNKVIKKPVVIIILTVLALFAVFTAVKNIIPTAQEKEFCQKLNSLAEKHLIKSVYDEKGVQIDFYAAGKSFSSRVVFSFAEDETRPAEIYSARLKVGSSGKIRKVKEIINLSNTPDAEEGVFAVRNGWVAFATSMGASFQSVTTIRTSGQYRKLFVFKPAVKKLQLNWDSGLKVRAHYRLKDEIKTVSLNPIKGIVTPETAEFKYFPEVKGEESLIAACVNFARGITGPEFIGNLEAVFFSIKDWFDNLTYSLSRFFNRVKSGFKEGKADTALKNIEPLIKNEPLKGEGIWTAEGLPQAEDKDLTLLARTIIRPDPERPYALVDLLYIDTARTEIFPVAGTIHPVSTTGIKGKGIIPYDDDTREKVLLAFSGGFQAVHGAYGMMAEGDMLLPPVKEIETIAMYADGSIKMGVWDEDIKETPSMVSFRQNLKPLIKKGIFNDKNKYWGLSADKNKSIYVWRTGFGLTREGKAVFAIGNSVSAYTLAKAMLLAGVEEAMHLDMNLVNVACEIYTPEKDEKNAYKRGKDGEILLKAVHLNERYFGAPGRYLKPHTRDFFYISKRKK